VQTHVTLVTDNGLPF